MRTFFLVLFTSMLFGNFGFAQVIPAHETSLLSPLHFTNRAQCALDSEKPTNQILVLIDGYNAGKTAHSLARIQGFDTDQYSKRAMREFRLTVAFMTLDIMNKMIRGQLPILPANIKGAPLSRYVSALKNCEQAKGDCQDLNNYIAGVWARAGQKNDLLAYDNFTRANFPQHKTPDRLGCYFIKKFSGLQGQLQNAEVTQANLQDVAVSYLNSADYITGCFDTDETLDNRFVTLQIDWETNAATLEKQGFDFWNSAKLYLAWAWRYSNQLETMSPTFGNIFKSIALEESILFTPLGCKSMTKPACDSTYTSINSIRELAKVSVTSGEHYQNVPDGLDQEMLKKGVRGVNNDFLGTVAFPSAQEWLGNFRKNLVQTRGLMKTKYQSAVQNLNLLQDKLGAGVLSQSLNSDLKFAGNSEQVSNELYYLCTELRLAGDDQLDFLKSDIDRLAQLKNMTQMQYSERRSLTDHVAFFRSVVGTVLPVCTQLEKSNYWNRGDYTVDKSGFQPWAKEMLNISQKPEEGAPAPFVSRPYSGTPLLAWKDAAGLTSSVVCTNAIDCTRLMIKSMIDLYAVSTYADAMVPMAGAVSDPALFNPYAELKTCKMYDPWFNTNRMNKVFMTDLANTALFGWNILPIYVDADWTAPKVSSFKQLVENGTIKYDPRVEKSKLDNSMVADFGPLTGAPCAVSLNNNGLRTFDFYSFSGITVSYCDSKQNANVISNDPKDVASSGRRDRTFCGGCTLNFTAVASAASVSTLGIVNPAKFVVYLFRTFSKYFDAKKDKVNLPKAWDVNAAYAADVYKKYGQIPTYCVEQLGMGLRCFKDICAAQAADFFEKNYGGKVTDIYLRQDDTPPPGKGDHYAPDTSMKKAWIKTDLCRGETTMTFKCSPSFPESFRASTSNVVPISKSCRSAVGRR
jgi:hypothetical protein